MEPKPLTKYPVGSIREVAHLSFPLMMMMLSTSIMLFADRWILSEYSAHAMDAVALAGGFYIAIEEGVKAIAMMAEVFVGQFNGSNQKHRIGQAVWQMVWLSVFSTPVFIILAFALRFFIFDTQYGEEGIGYYNIMMYFGPLAPIAGALASFYIGRGRNLPVFAVIVITNIINIGLDYLLIFGYGDIIPKMGAKGAAIATVIALFAQVFILVFLILQKKYRKVYGVLNWKLDGELFKKAFFSGSPFGVAIFTICLAWAFFYWVISKQEQALFTAVVITWNTYFLYRFFAEGVGKAVAAITSNLIGANTVNYISKVTRSSIYFLLFFGVLLFVPMMIYPEWIADCFLAEDSNYEAWVLSIEGIRWCWLFYIMDCFGIVFLNNLIAAGDTKFIMIQSVLVSWLFLAVPGFVAMKYFSLSGNTSWKMMAIYLAITHILIYFRYRKFDWTRGKIVKVPSV